jgi:hypothetical protein
VIPPGYFKIRWRGNRRAVCQHVRLIGRSTEGIPWPQTPPPPPPHPQPKRAVPREFSMWTLPSWIAPSAIFIFAIVHCAWMQWWI